jgi:hypothetical protein
LYIKNPSRRVPTSPILRLRKWALCTNKLCKLISDIFGRRYLACGRGVRDALDRFHGRRFRDSARRASPGLVRVRISGLPSGRSQSAVLLQHGGSSLCSGFTERNTWLSANAWSTTGASHAAPSSTQGLQVFSVSIYVSCQRYNDILTSKCFVLVYVSMCLAAVPRTGEAAAYAHDDDGVEPLR